MPRYVRGLSQGVVLGYLLKLYGLEGLTKLIEKVERMCKKENECTN